MPDPTPAAAPTITIAAGVDELAAVRAFVRAHVAAADGDVGTVADFVQAVDELVCNVVGHGYAGRPGRVEVTFLASPRELAFRIRDDAPPFDPTTVPEPNLDLPLARRRLGGMGVHLARTLTDGFDHRILPSGGNEVTVRKQRRATTGDATDGHHDRPAEG